MRIRLLPMLVLLVVAGVAGAAIYRASARPTEGERLAEQAAVRATGLVEPVGKRLASGFTPAGDTLLAAPPADPKRLRDPDSIVFAHLDSSDGDSRDYAGVDWRGLEKRLGDATGRPVVDAAYDASPAQMSAIHNGRVTLVALHAADTPFLVNHYGFHPVAILAGGGTAGAVGNKLDLIVPAASPIRSPADLRGQTLACTVPSSITGYRAAVALLMADQQLRPDVDYLIVWSLKQKASIRGVADGTYPAAAVSDDKLQSMLKAGDVKADAVRTVYQSDVIPRVTVGYFYDLQPELASKLTAGVLSYSPPSADAGRFLPVDYRKDFALVREIDDRFDPRLDVTPHGDGGPTTAP